MPTLHIEFDPTGGTLFEIQYRPLGSTNPYDTTQVNGSPADITVPTANPYEYCVRKICEPGNDSVPICGTAIYIPPCLTPQFSFASRSGNNLTFNYVLQPNQVQFDLEVTAPAGGLPVVTRYQTSQMPSPFTIQLLGMMTGTYRFRMRGVCGAAVNSAVSDWTDFVDVAVVVSPCIAPSDIIVEIVNEPPVVAIKWNDNQGVEDRSCLQNSCSFVIAVTATDNNNDISSLQVMKSLDQGATWNLLLTLPTNITSTTFGDSINVNGTNWYKVVATDLTGLTSESNILSYRGKMTFVDYAGMAYSSIYKPDSGSQWVGQIKISNLQASTFDGSNIVQVKLRCKFLAIGENITFDRTETFNVPSPAPSIIFTQKFVYGFRQNGCYVGTRDWNGATQFVHEVTLITANGNQITFPAAGYNQVWFPDYNQAIQ